MSIFTMIFVSCAGVMAGLGLTGGGGASIRRAKRCFVVAGLFAVVAGCSFLVDHAIAQNIAQTNNSGAKL